MISPHDADLARRDPELPGLATALDPPALVAALNGHLPGPVTGARITYVRYKPLKGCLVVLRLETAAGPVDLCAKANPATNGHAQGRADANRSEPGEPGRFVLANGALTISVLPRDHKLKSLPRVDDVGLRHRLLRKLVPDRPDLWDGSISQLNYLPERRYVACLTCGGEPAAVLKLYNREGYDAARPNVNAFRSDAPLRIGSCLGQSDRRRILLHEWLPGRLLKEALPEPGLDTETLAPVGAALARLHAQDPAGLALNTREFNAGRLLALSANLASTLPHLAERLDRLVTRLAAGLLAAPQGRHAIHADFYARQVLLGHDSVAFLDFDRAARGDPATDLGTFLAYLQLLVARGTLRAERAAALGGAFLGGYRKASRRPLPVGIPMHMVVGLVRFAAQPFHDHEPDWPAQTEAILVRAEALQQNGG